MNDKVYVPLFDFNTLFDIDFGIMSLIGSEYLDSSIFNMEWFKQHSTNRSMVKALYERVDSNPLIQSSLPGIDNKELDELYKSFIDDKEIYSKILNKSMPTELYNLFETYTVVGDIFPYVCYKNNEELEFLKKFNAFSKLGDERFVKLDSFIMNQDKYSEILQFYAKSCDDMFMTAVASMLHSIKDGIFRTVYIADYVFNRQDENKLKATTSVLDIVANDHYIRTVDIYVRSRLEDDNDNRGVQNAEDRISEAEDKEQKETTRN